MARARLIAVVAVALASACSHAAPHTAQASNAPIPAASTSVVLSLPSDGWKPGDPALTAATAGPFHAVRVGNVACAWVGNTRRAMAWPAGWNVSFGPTPRLINATGHLVAREGQRLMLGGGGAPARGRGPCWTAGDWVFSVMQ